MYQCCQFHCKVLICNVKLSVHDYFVVLFYSVSHTIYIYIFFFLMEGNGSQRKKKKIAKGLQNTLPVQYREGMHVTAKYKVPSYLKQSHFVGQSHRSHQFASQNLLCLSSIMTYGSNWDHGCVQRMDKEGDLVIEMEGEKTQIYI